MFSALLRYLYTGDLGGSSGTAGVDMALLHRLGEEFGHPSPLEHDLRYLLETGEIVVIKMSRTFQIDSSIIILLISFIALKGQ